MVTKTKIFLILILIFILVLLLIINFFIIPQKTKISFPSQDNKQPSQTNWNIDIKIPGYTYVKNSLDESALLDTLLENNTKIPTSVLNVDGSTCNFNKINIEFEEISKARIEDLYLTVRGSETTAVFGLGPWKCKQGVLTFTPYMSRGYLDNSVDNSLLSEEFSGALIQTLIYGLQKENRLGLTIKYPNQALLKIEKLISFLVPTEDL